MEPHSQQLLDSDDSVLIAIDVQTVFLDKIPPGDAERIVERVSWLVELAQWRQVPVVATAERAASQPLAPQVMAALGDHVDVVDKSVFGLADQAETMAAVEQIAPGRATAVLVGLETDVCVLHSALGLLRRGFRVAVVVDAIGSPSPGHEIGMERLRAAGVVMVDTKGLFYEWLRSIDEVDRLHRERPNMRAAISMQL